MIDAAYVTRRLEHAGATLLAIPSKACLPDGMGRDWPDAVHELVQLCAWRPGQMRPPLPEPEDIIAMDTVWQWVAAMPRTRRTRLAQRLLLLRSLVDPVNERHRFAWRHLERLLGLPASTLQRAHAEAVEQMVARLAEQDAEAAELEAA